MANEKYYSKVIYGDTTLIDITSTTAEEADVASGKKFYKRDGSPAFGTNTKDCDTSDATVTASEILSGSIGYANGNKITGTMPNIGAQNGTISTVAEEISIQQGYHDGSGKVKINPTEQAKIIAGNIKLGVQLLGVTGTYDGGELIKATVGSATPALTSQVILPSSVGNYDYFTQFTVGAIPYTEVINEQGGYTATIGASA